MCDWKQRAVVAAVFNPSDRAGVNDEVGALPVRADRLQRSSIRLARVAGVSKGEARFGVGVVLCLHCLNQRHSE